MKTATIHELKQELLNLQANELTELTLKLAKFKKENKELLTYLLFEAQDETGYIASVKKEMEEQFAEINKSNLYYVKKTLRKIVRTLNKYSRYTGSSVVTVEILIHFCSTLKASGIPFQKSPLITNLYKSQLQKINKELNTLHEDLQYDYRKEVEALEL
jgi:membrane-anchored protein YejM (alkaline phosphatase superfamily)